MINFYSNFPKWFYLILVPEADHDLESRNNRVVAFSVCVFTVLMRPIIMTCSQARVWSHSHTSPEASTQLHDLFRPRGRISHVHVHKRGMKSVNFV